MGFLREFGVFCCFAWVPDLVAGGGGLRGFVGLGCSVLGFGISTLGRVVFGGALWFVGFVGVCGFGFVGFGVGVTRP